VQVFWIAFNLCAVRLIKEIYVSVRRYMYEAWLEKFGKKVMHELIVWIHTSEAPSARHAEVAALAAITIGENSDGQHSVPLEEAG
jgi:hypothetical protein